MFKSFLILMFIVLLNAIVVAYCFPVAVLSMDVIAQISVIIFGSSLFTAALLNSIYHTCAKTIDK